MSDLSLRITEIFYSLQGEANTVGLPTTFIRLTGCPLRCGYCDSEYAFFGGEKLQLAAIIDRVHELGGRHVCVTGGEPLAQPSCLQLLKLLCDEGSSVSLETSGAMDISAVDPRVHIVMDLKTPGSGEVGKNLYSNIMHLKMKDQVKFVICSKEDYDWSKFKIDEYHLYDRVADVLFSPSFTQINPKDLAEWILADKLAVRFQVQLHKQLWGDLPGV